MKPFYKFIDHTADVLFVAKAEKLPELFQQCALAVEETMVETKKVALKKKIKILGESEKIDSLLFDFIDDLIFFKDYQQLVFSAFDITMEEKEGKYQLKCIASGEKIDYARHHPKVDVKAVTRHMFKVEQVKGNWKATVLLDI